MTIEARRYHIKDCFSSGPIHVEICYQGLCPRGFWQILPPPPFVKMHVKIRCHPPPTSVQPKLVAAQCLVCGLTAPIFSQPSRCVRWRLKWTLTRGNKKHDWDLHIACLFHMPWGSWTYDLEVSRGASRSSVHSCLIHITDIRIVSIEFFKVYMISRSTSVLDYMIFYSILIPRDSLTIPPIWLNLWWWSVAFHGTNFNTYISGHTSGRYPKAGGESRWPLHFKVLTVAFQ